MAITLILGGARSGKSARAEYWAAQSNKPVCYVATAPVIAGDQEWDERIQRHQRSRPAAWQTIEEPLNLVSLLHAQQGCLLIDCLTLWLNNVLYAELDIENEGQKLAAALQVFAGDVILVSNEVGLGLVPETELGRIFRDAQGRLNQQLGAIAHRVEFVAAGLPLTLKGKE